MFQSVFTLFSPSIISSGMGASRYNCQCLCPRAHRHSNEYVASSYPEYALNAQRSMTFSAQFDSRVQREENRSQWVMDRGGTHPSTQFSYDISHSVYKCYMLARSIQIRQASSVKSIGTGEDVAGLVSYLASENSRFVSGEWCRVIYYCYVLRKMLGGCR